MSEAFQNEEELRERRKKRMEEMRRSKEKQLRRRMLLKRLVPVTAGLFAVVIIAVAGVLFVKQQKQEESDGKKIVFQTGQDKEYASIAVMPESLAGEVISADGVSEESSLTALKEQNTDIQSAEVKRQESEEKEQSSEAKGQEFEAKEQASEAKGQESEEKEQAAKTKGQEDMQEKLPAAVMPEEEIAETVTFYSAETTQDTLYISDEIVSTYAVFIDLESNSILARKGENQIISPASMTKILTVLVAAEHVTDLDDTFTMTLDITDYSFKNDCSNAGFLDGEVVTVRDLFYGTVLPSGGDAAVGLATYVAGSHEEFVKLMNKKLEELGLSDTAHVTNCVGLYDEDHYCTVYDMAMILEAAIENELCREVLSAHTYTTSPTEQHPEGILLSNWFLRRIEDKDTGGVVMCAKTGYVDESGSCAASYGIDNGGKGYICVTADSTSSWRCIYDHVALYKQFATGDEDETLSASGNVENG